MKTLSDFKRRVKVGAKVHTVYHQKTNGSRDEQGRLVLVDEDRGQREISIVQSNSFALKTIRHDGSETNSYCNFPKASELKIIDENTVQILAADFREREKINLIPLLTFKFIN